MPITRHQAQGLLSTAEMELYDESRSNPLRKLDEAALQKRIDRMRRARERARDLVQKQKLASRDATGSKRGTSGVANQRSKDKAALLDDILKRFEGALNPGAKAAAKPAAATATKKAARKTTATKPKKASPRVVAREALRQMAGSTAAPAKAPARKISARDVAAKKRIQATRAKKKTLDRNSPNERAHRSWQSRDAVDASSSAGPGSMSPGAANRAKRLHAGQSRTKPIQGSVSTRGKRNQARRDGRNSDG
ncbi:hypothetical protein MNQ95_04910 [Pseudoxanthomonas daejeonensis]|uniref:Uncharacterized protein n=1 Tax=Pseudoxanthomonas daejeonensis TaxID=266062 RepID=A0ABQ6Z4G4_9GAMM|nr:hypothetical protein [Pseudoxanthomonas daejeonensis]KAF1692442.1 hypothetical protein CSC65_14540 [Pseudoxanthomonas daejeonensis]UNK58439.1 hypothetical protein MNQ95_04910 [Pseudoxanthomonas daejeonensis]